MFGSVSAPTYFSEMTWTLGICIVQRQHITLNAIRQTRQQHGPQTCVTSPRDNYAICTQQMFLNILQKQQKNSIANVTWLEISKP